jgi:antitoxin component YwqK of YwqJK toxin-antitoxin module
MRILAIVILVFNFLSCTNVSSNTKANNSERVINYYPNGKIQEIKYFKDSMLNGECFWFYPSGKLEQKVTYEKSSVNGQVYFYYESGVIKEHKFYINGMPFGYATTYYDDTISIIKQILLFNGEGKLAYKKEFDSDGNVISVEGKKY